MMKTANVNLKTCRKPDSFYHLQHCLPTRIVI